MYDSDWAKLKYFKKNENFGNPNMMDLDFMLRLDKFRADVGPVVISCGTQGEHVAGSFHYQGKAADIILPDCQLHMLDVVFLALQAGMTGVGYYPHWSYQGKVTGGFHLDYTLDRKYLWLGVFERGEQVYRRMTEINLKKIGAL